MKIAAIINPKSGGGETFKVWKKIKSQALQRLGVFDEIITRAPQEAIGFAKQVAKNNYDLLIIMGGDGTIHEVINGLIDQNDGLINPRLKIGIINGGRGCDYIKSLHLPTDPRESLSVIVDGRTRRVDVGRVDLMNEGKQLTKYYINSCSFGLGGDVAKKMLSQKILIHPTVSYFLTSGLEFFLKKPYDFKVFIGTNEEEIKGPFLNFFACNGRFSGGGMYWAPQAQIDDGKLDLVLIRPISKTKFIFSGHKIYDGTIQSLSEVEHKAVDNIHVVAGRPSWIELDGEVYLTSEFRIRPLNKVLEFMVP